MSIIEIKVPDIGGHENVDVIAVDVKVGDSISLEQSLITLETDKATMEVPADAAGVVKEVKIKVGDKVSEGQVIVLVESDSANAVQTPEPETKTSPVSETPSAVSGSIVEVKVPDIGGHENVDVIAVDVKVGDTISSEQSLITLETDKATMEVPSSAAGVVKSVFIKVGDKVSEGNVILEVISQAASRVIRLNHKKLNLLKVPPQ